MSPPCPYCDRGEGDIFACTCLPATEPAPPTTGTAVASDSGLDDESEPAWVVEAGQVVAWR